MRVGVIGFGKAGRQHADAARRSGEAELVAVADPAPAAAQAADALGVRCWPDYEAMLDAIDLDAVVVSLPHAALPAAALAAAGRGRHVLLEKPMAATSLAAHEVVQACRIVEEKGDGTRHARVERGRQLAVAREAVDDRIGGHRCSKGSRGDIGTMRGR